jgi:hypothetical protein
MFLFRLRSDLQTAKEMDVIGIGFQHVIDSYFWYLPFASVRQCKYVLDKAQISTDEWTAKRDDLAEEHKTPGAREQLKQGFKNWMTSDLFKEQRSTAVPVPKSTKTIIVEDD